MITAFMEENHPNVISCHLFCRIAYFRSISICYTVDLLFQSSYNANASNMHFVWHQIFPYILSGIINYFFNIAFYTIDIPSSRPVSLRYSTYSGLWGNGMNVLLISRFYIFQGYVLVGASCSTVGGGQHGLYRKYMHGRQYFQCRCGGTPRADAFKSGSDKLKCTMHFWECPLHWCRCWQWYSV